MKNINKFFTVCFHLISLSAYSQNPAKDNVAENIFLKIDTAVFSTEKNTQTYLKEKYVFFKYLNNNDLCEVTFIPKVDSSIEKIQLLSSADFTIIDSLRHFNEKYYRSKIKFNDLDNAKLLSLIFHISYKSGKFLNHEIKLYPYKETYISYDNEPMDLFLDEEVVIELPCMNVYNIKIEELDENPNFEAKISPTVNALKLNLKPKILGSKVFTLKLKTIKPFIDKNDEISYDLPPIRIKFNVKPNRVDYINPGKFTVYFNPDFKASEEMEFDYNRNMGLKKTYRIEDQQENGGNLIAEIFTQSQVGNSNKVICRVRTFGLHRIGDGYLYIKDGDKTRFLTNFNIVEKPRIDDISIMHDGEDWTGNLSVNPGEKIEVRIKGTGLQQSPMQFEGIENARLDSTRLSDEVAFYTLKIPINIPKKKINVFMNKKSTQYSMMIREFQRPTDFDFVSIDYNNSNIALSSDYFNKPIFYDGEIKDINVLFDRSKIDEGGALNGKQYLDIEIKIFNSQNNLLEMQTLNNIVVCPNENSPRGSFYDLNDCKNLTLSLNDYLVHKTYTLDAFTQIYVTVKHNELKYGNKGYSKNIKIILKKKYNVDVEVSFPAGLLTYKFGNKSQDGNTVLENFSGISIAFIAQFRFYEANNVNKFKPWSLGAGFIAIDAFNFSQSNKTRDLGIVALGTLTPIQRGKLSFPLYLGGGYLVNQQKWFVLFGPGLRISF